MSASNSPWLSVKEAAVYIGVRVSTLYSYVSHRRIPFYKIPGSQLVKFKISEIDAWLESGRCTPDESPNEENTE